MDRTTDRISIGILDPISKAAGFTSAFIESSEPEEVARGEQER